MDRLSNMKSSSSTSMSKTSMRPGHMRHSTENDPSSLSSFTFASLPSEVAEKEEDKTINVKRAIGSGAFGVVYLAEYGRERQLVAVKKVLQDKRYKNREHQIISELAHPNVVGLKATIFTTDPKDDAVYLNLVLEYLPEDMHSLIKRHTKSRDAICEFNIKLYMYQLMRSMLYIHSFNICHRDIKPQNVLVDSVKGIVKLCDFGSAKKLVKNEPNVSYICSRFYRAPELIFGATEYTTAVDMWAVGCVLAELVQGNPLFTGENGVDQLVEIIKVLGTPSHGDILAMNKNSTDFNFPNVVSQRWESIFPESSPELVDLISQLLCYRPQGRLSPLDALAHPFFDELRLEGLMLPNGLPVPDLFNFTEVEFGVNFHKVNALIPAWRKRSISAPLSSPVESPRSFMISPKASPEGASQDFSVMFSDSDGSRHIGA